MFETFAALILFTLVLAFWRGLWTAIIFAAIAVFMFSVGGSFIITALTNDSGFAIILALLPAAGFAIYTLYQTAKIKREFDYEEALKTRISEQNKEGGSIGVEGQPPVVHIDEDVVLSTDGSCTPANGNWVGASRSTLVND